ncbi:phage tail terminator protein [Pasteurella multocida]|uniref:phage tail terminator protein n=1 Tax=Pasteurella multocida TaxID=747 RepID=UPI0039786907
MQYGPFDLKLVIEQLKPLQPEHIYTLGSTAEYRSITDVSLAGLPTPAVFVVPNGEIGTLNDVAVRQMVTVSFSVIVIVQSYQYNIETPHLSISNPVIGKIREQLMGWRPPLPGAKETFFVRGDVVDYSNAYLVWIETYQTKVIMGKSK